MALSEQDLLSKGVMPGPLIYTDRGRRFTVKPKTVRPFRTAKRAKPRAKGRRR